MGKAAGHQLSVLQNCCLKCSYTLRSQSNVFQSLHAVCSWQQREDHIFQLLIKWTYQDNLWLAFKRTFEMFLEKWMPHTHQHLCKIFINLTFSDYELCYFSLYKFQLMTSTSISYLYEGQVLITVVKNIWNWLFILFLDPNKSNSC